MYHINSVAPSPVVKSSSFEPGFRPNTFNTGRYAMPSRRPLANSFRKGQGHMSARREYDYLGPVSVEVPLKQIIESRPPLRTDLSTPGPWHYSPHFTKPLNETNAPAYSMRPKCWPEKEKKDGGRTSWSKTWYQTPEVWTSKADFQREVLWPDPHTYDEQLAIGGPHQPRLKRFPAHTFGHRDQISFAKTNSEKEPCPNSYHRDKADSLVYKRAPTIIHSFRDRNSNLWGKREKTPGPAQYTPNSAYLHKHQPSFSIGRSPRQAQQPQLGPFAC